MFKAGSLGYCRKMSMIEAIRDAMDVKMGRRPECADVWRGLSVISRRVRCTAGLQEKHGPAPAVSTTPISRSGIIACHRHGSGTGYVQVAEIPVL